LTGSLARLHGDEMLALEPEQASRTGWRLTHKLGELLLAHIIAGRQAACENIRAEVLVDIIAQKHRIFSPPAEIWQSVKYHVK